jgi:YbgC/YbaW family acyl-CoA thioester hydrolase
MHTTDINVRFGELDAYGHVNHAVYLSYFEAARVEALAAVGFGLDRLQREGFLIVVVDLRLRLRRPAVLGDVLTVETELLELRQASSRGRQRILRDGEEIASAELRGAITDLEGRPRRAPAGLADALAPLGRAG